MRLLRITTIFVAEAICMLLFYGVASKFICSASTVPIYSLLPMFVDSTATEPVVRPPPVLSDLAHGVLADFAVGCVTTDHHFTKVCALVPGHRVYNKPFLRRDLVPLYMAACTVYNVLDAASIYIETHSNRCPSTYRTRRSVPGFLMLFIWRIST